MNKGRFWAVYRSWDSQGQYCGIDNTQIGLNATTITLKNYVDYPYLFFSAHNVSNQFCVKACPSNGSLAEAYTEFCEDDNKICPLGETDKSLCSCPYKSNNILNRCVPDTSGIDLVNMGNFVSGFNTMMASIGPLDTAMSSIIDLWLPIVICSVLSLAVAFVWVFLLRFITSLIVYLVVLLVPVILIGAGFYLFMSGSSSYSMSSLQSQASNNLTSTSKIFAYIIWGIAFIVILIILFLFRKLRQAVQMIKISAKALGANIMILFVPLLTLILVVLYWGGILVSSVLNYTACEFVEQGGKIIFNFNKTQQYLLLYNLVYLVFISLFISFVNYYSMSTPIVSWYFSGQAMFGCGTGCFRGFILAHTKSLGTITVSALIMTPIYLMIIFMEYLDQKAKKENIPQFVQFIIKCFKCCLWCFAKIFKYINKSLLTASQIFNKGWWSSAQIVSEVVLSDAILTLILNGVSFFIIFLSKVVVSGACTFIFFYYVGRIGTTGWLIPSCVVFLLSYLISSFILSAFDNVIDIVFVCFQSENSIPGYSAGDSTRDIKDTIEEMKLSAMADDPRVAAVKN